MISTNMDEIAKWTRHFRLMAAGKLRKDPKGYYIVNQTPQDQMGGAESSLDPSSIMDKIPERYRDKAESILNYIIRDKKKILAWNKTGQLIYEDVEIPESNIIDLLIDSQNQVKDKNIAGILQFNRGLNRLEVPTQLYVIPTTRKRPFPPGIPSNRKLRKLYS